MAQRLWMKTLAGIGLCCWGTAAVAGPSKTMPKPERVAEIAAMLPEKPKGLGLPIDRREEWEALVASGTYKYFLMAVDRDLDTPIPKVTEEIYRRIVISGSRPDWYGIDNKRSNRFRQYVLAECLENKGRFLPHIEQGLQTFFSENTWYIPLYNKSSTANFEGRGNNIDLYKAMRSWEVATTDWLLGDRLQPETRRALRENLERRILSPFRAMVRGDRKADWWFRTTNNWNAVCLSGVVGAALTVVESREDRAFYVAAAEIVSQGLLKGFPPDGYCTEGMGYWNYGFGHYVAMTEAIHQATGGQIDLLDRPNMRNIAMYGPRIEILNGVYPAIADCSTKSSPSPRMMRYVSLRLGLGLRQYEEIPLSGRLSGNLYERMLNAFPTSADAEAPAPAAPTELSARSYFDSAGILVCRPGPNSKARMGVCLKGGHNAEHHNHNDVGSFTVVVGAESPICDIGAEVYTHRTFSKRRYESEALSSYGHSTPVVGGTFQRPGRDAVARVLTADFGEESDTFTLDLRAAYDVPECTKLERSFEYSRAGEGKLTVTDRVAFTSPQSFGVALLTFGTVKQLGSASVLLYNDREALRADFVAANGNGALSVKEIKEDLRTKATALRIGFDLSEPVQEGELTVHVQPADHPTFGKDPFVPDGGFEKGFEHWEVRETRVPMSQISEERAASGTRSLYIKDTHDNVGSSVGTGLFPLEVGKHYELRGKVWSVSGEDLGVVTRFHDIRGKEMKIPEDEVRLMGTVFLGGKDTAWRSFSKTFSPPPGTRYGRVWIHSLSAAKVEAFLDDLEVVPVR